VNLAEQLTIWKFLDEKLAQVHDDNLVPRGQEELTPGERHAVKFGAQDVAAWVSLPQPTQRKAVVSGPDRLLAWAKANYPEKIEYRAEVIVDAGLIEFLQEHRPQSLHTTERPDPQWVSDILAGLSGKDHRYITATGEPLTEVPGIETPEPRPASPRVNLTKDAGAVIAAAWPQIQAGLREVLALPAPETPPATMADPAEAAENPFSFWDEDGRFRSPEMAAMHAVMVQGGFSTPVREARRMLRDARRSGDARRAAEACEWLESRGLSLEGDDEPPLARKEASGAS